MEEIVGHPDQVDQQQGYQEIEHEGQPEGSDPVNPFTYDRGGGPFPKHPHQERETSDQKITVNHFFEAGVQEKTISPGV